MEYEDYQTNIQAYEHVAEQISEEQRKVNANKWRDDPKFKAIKPITKSDLLNGTGQIEKLKFPPWDKKNSEGKQTEQVKPDGIGYGKYADKTYEWVKENDLRYYLWMTENVPKFAAKAKQLGL
jgi:hypothetical protein